MQPPGAHTDHWRRTSPPQSPPVDEALERSGQPRHLETSGVDPLSGQFDWITLSPKRHQPPLAEVLQCCHELKVVVHTPEDLVFADAMASGSGPQTALLLQPGWNSPTGQQLTLDHVRQHPRWRLSLQTHKWLGVR